MKGSATKYVERLNARERLLHWLHFVAFMTLLVTGFVLYTPIFQAAAQGDSGYGFRLMHRVGAILFMCGPVLYLLLTPKKLFENLKAMFTFEWRDVTWALNIIGLYTTGRTKNMLPQGKFNAGQKMNTIIQVIGFVVFTITGLIMWFAKGAVSPEVMYWTILLHDLMMIVMVAIFIVHLYLVAINKVMRDCLPAIFTGKVSEQFAEHHHGKWFDDVKKRELMEKAKVRAEAAKGK